MKQVRTRDFIYTTDSDEVFVPAKALRYDKVRNFTLGVAKGQIGYFAEDLAVENVDNLFLFQLGKFANHFKSLFQATICREKGFYSDKA